MKRKTAKKLIETFNDEELYDLGFYAGRDIIEHYASGGEFECVLADEEWLSFQADPAFYRAVKPTYTLLGIEIEGEPPLSEVPEQDQFSYFISPAFNRCYDRSIWSNSTWQKLLLKRGLLFATEEGAKTAAKALGWCDEEDD